jgi:saccharopine dehydrogenase (NAD+, L-lysine-forming)
VGSARNDGKPGPYKEITDSDVFINCIYLSDEIPPFVNDKSLSDPNRKLSVVCDVSCETTNPHNPISIYKENSTFDRPTLPVKVERDPPLTITSIDYLPSLLPREASEAFSKALLPSLLQLKERKTACVWTQAEKLFTDKVMTLPESLRSTFAAVTG